VPTDYGVHRPSRALFLTEPARGVLTLATLPLNAPWLNFAPRGDGHTVLVLPGLRASDISTRPLRYWLRRLGYDVRGWGLGRNLGPTEKVLAGMDHALELAARDSGGPVSLVGWSLGGIFARELARTHRSSVRQVITMGSPFALVDPAQSRAEGAYRRTGSQHVDRDRLPSREQLRKPIPVPSTAVFSRRDGVVDWAATIEPDSASHENVEVRCGHLGFGVDPATYWVIADRLALEPGQWQRFRAPRHLAHFFPGSRG
jgi:pimeloyl-ACP methyl ester carboxylesterase